MVKFIKVRGCFNDSDKMASLVNLNEVKYITMIDEEQAEIIFTGAAAVGKEMREPFMVIDLPKGEKRNEFVQILEDEGLIAKLKPKKQE